ncbi:hypothetical protein Tco_1361243 [Tanacetum coccineum]
MEKYEDKNLGGAQENPMQPNIKDDDPHFEGVIYVLVEIIRMNHPEVIALVETHLDGDRAERLGRQIQYDGHNG